MAFSNDLVPPYSGDKPYIFISYAHKDREERTDVDAIILYLQSRGFRVWYDEGIDPGTEWDENIASHVEKCGYFIALISKKYLASTNCKDELNYARDLDKKRLMIYLEECELPRGIAMRINRLQSIFMYKYSRFEDFSKKLSTADGIDVCLSDVNENDVADEEMRGFWDKIDARYKAEFGIDADETEPVYEFTEKEEEYSDEYDDFELPVVEGDDEETNKLFRRIDKLFLLFLVPLMLFVAIMSRRPMWEYAIAFEDSGYKSYQLVEQLVYLFYGVHLFICMTALAFIVKYLKKKRFFNAVLIFCVTAIYCLLNLGNVDFDRQRAKCAPIVEVYICTQSEHNDILQNKKSLYELTQKEYQRSDIPDTMYAEFFYSGDEYAVVTQNSLGEWKQLSEKLNLPEDVYAVYFPADYIRYLFVSGQYGG